MKPTSSFCLAVLLALGGSGLSARESLFNENFDQEPPYADNADLPHGYGEGGPLHGCWIVSPSPLEGGAQTTSEHSVSAPRSLRLSVPESPGAAVNIMGAFAGQDKTRRLSVSVALMFQCAFRLEKTDGKTKGAFGIAIVGKNASQRLAQVRVHKGGRSAVEANFGGEWIDIPGEIESGRWYRIEISMPKDPGNAGAEYSVRLLDGEGKAETGSALGRLAVPSTDNESMYFSLGNSMPGTSVYVDDVMVVLAE